MGVVWTIITVKRHMNRLTECPYILCPYALQNHTPKMTYNVSKQTVKKYRNVQNNYGW